MGERKSSSGFTLVEIAISMIIIGLLIGGILKGQELVNNARIASTISQIKSIDTAYLTFRDIYRQKPGDHPRALTALPQCDTASFCQNGNGDNRVGIPYTGGDALGAKFYTESETVQFWKQMAMVDLIGDVDLNGNPANSQWGVTHPRAALGGGFEVFFNGAPLLGSPTSIGEMLRLTNNGLTPGQVDNPGEAVISPSVAAAMEAKMDDGVYNRGKMIVWDYGNHGCDNVSDGSEGFDARENSKSCVAFFILPK